MAILVIIYKHINGPLYCQVAPYYDSPFYAEREVECLSIRDFSIRDFRMDAYQ